MKLTKYLAVLCCGTLFAACENPIQDDLNVDNPENYTRIYTVNAVDDASKNTLSFPLERDTSLMVYANLSGIRNPGCDVTVKFRVAPELVDTYNQKHQSNYPMVLDGSYTIENLEAVIPNGKYISSPIRIAINSQAFDGVGVFLLPVRIENVTPDLAVNESLQTAYLRINGYYTENPFPRYDRSGWSIAGFSTQEAEATSTYPNRGLAVSIIDSENNTYWGTQWRNAKPGPPHWIAVDMGAPKELHGLTIRGRSDKEGSDVPNNTYWGTQWRNAKPGPPHWIAVDMGAPKELHGLTIRGRSDKEGSDVPKSSGNPRIFNIDVSDDNQNWTHAGTFTVENRIENTVYLDHKATGRYFRIFVTATQADLYQTCIAEVWAF